MKKRLTKEKLFEAAKNGDNKSLVLLLRSFETGIEAMDETEDPAWLIENKPAICQFYQRLTKHVLEFQWLARAYGDGDEHAGIYRNKSKSRSYFNEAIALGNPFAKDNLRLMEGRWKDELKYAREFELHVLGPSNDLEHLYCRLNHLFSEDAPTNVDIPLEELFIELVGVGEYAGVIHSVDRIHDVVIIRVYTEGNNNRFAIAFAIQQAFPTLRLDWEHLRKQ